MLDFSSHSTPLQLQRLSRNEAKAYTTIAQRASGLPLRLGAALWHVDLRPQGTTLPANAGDWTLSLEWAGACFELQILKTTAEQLATPLLAGASLPELPHELALAVVEAALADAIAALSSLGRGAPRLLDLRQDTRAPASAHPHSMALHMLAAEGSAAIIATLYADSLGLLLLAGLVSKRTPARPKLDEQLALRLPAEIGFTHLPANLLRTLNQGDVVLMDRCHIGEERVLWLSTDGTAGLQVQLPPVESENETASTPSLIVIQAWSAHMSAETPSFTTTASIEGIPIRLSFDLGEVVLSVAEARELQPGQAIALARPISGAVCIRANGAQAGEGDLVEIDGQLGIIIRSLFWAGGQEAE